MTNLTLTRKATAFAIKAHAGQFRKGSGLPYVTHPIEVFSIVKKYKESRAIDELMAAAALHDVAEDTEYGLDYIRKEYGALVASLVEEVTSDPHAIRVLGKHDYMIQKCMSMTSWALVIKLADFIANMTDQPNHKSVIRTTDVVNALEARYPLTETHKSMIVELRRVFRELHTGITQVEA